MCPTVMYPIVPYCIVHHHTQALYKSITLSLCTASPCTAAAACEECQKSIEKLRGKLMVKEAARAVSERDDRLLIKAMEDLESANREVGGRPCYLAGRGGGGEGGRGGRERWGSYVVVGLLWGCRGAAVCTVGGQPRWHVVLHCVATNCTAWCTAGGRRRGRGGRRGHGRH